uniref:Uncharacterized protein n=1 Tax=Macaca fascicularis TaxID=9541 RepID=A0A7N9IFX5_MACFA
PTWRNPVSTKYTKLAGRGSAYLQSQLLGRLRQENLLNPGGRACSKLRLHHCTPAWATRVKLHLKKKREPTFSLCEPMLCNGTESHSRSHSTHWEALGLSTSCRSSGTGAG